MPLAVKETFSLPRYFMQTFFHRPWFQRVWVFQEAILAKKTLLHSAHETIDWREGLMVEGILSSREWANRALNFRVRNSIPSILKKLIDVNPRSDSANLQSGPRSIGNLSNSWEEAPLPIIDVFLSALDMKATDPRDKLLSRS